MRNENVAVAPTKATATKSRTDQGIDPTIVAAPAEAVDPVEAVRKVLADTVAGTLAVLVAESAPTTGPARTRRRVYLTLTAAQRAVDDARDRGQQAAAVVVELRPVGILGATS